MDIKPYAFRTIELGNTSEIRVLHRRASPAEIELARGARSHVQRHIGSDSEFTGRYTWHTPAEVQLLAAYADALVAYSKANRSFFGPSSDAERLHHEVSLTAPGRPVPKPAWLSSSKDFAVLSAYALRKMDAFFIAREDDHERSNHIAEAALSLTYAVLCKPFVDLSRVEEELPKQVRAERIQHALAAKHSPRNELVRLATERFLSERQAAGGSLSASQASKKRAMQEYIRSEASNLGYTLSPDRLQKTIYEWLRQVEKGWADSDPSASESGQK